MSSFVSNIQHFDSIKEKIDSLYHFLEYMKDYGHVHATSQDIARITALTNHLNDSLTESAEYAEDLVELACECFGN